MSYYTTKISPEGNKILGFIKSDQSLLTDMIQKYYGKLLSFVRLKGCNLQESEDIIQSSIADIYIAAKSQNGEPNLWNDLKYKDRNELIEVVYIYFKKHFLLHTIKENWKHINGVCFDEDDWVFSKDKIEIIFEEKERLTKILKSLTESEKELLLLHAAGYTYAEIADMNKLSAGNVRIKIFRIKQKIGSKI